MTAEQKTILDKEAINIIMHAFKKQSNQEFARDQVLINQSIDPYQRILEASKQLLSKANNINSETASEVHED